MTRTTVDLDEGDYTRLLGIAQESGRSLEVVVHEAIAEYLVRHLSTVPPNGAVKREARVVERRQLTPEEEAEWRRRFEEARRHRVPDRRAASLPRPG